MDGRALVRAIRRAGRARGLRVVRGSWRRRRADRALVARSRVRVRARVPGTVQRVDPEPGGGVVRFTRSVLRVRVAVGGAVFLGWDGAEPGPSYAVAEDGCPPVDSRVRLEADTAGGWRVVSERVLVVVARHGAVEIRTPGGLLLRRDQPPRWWEPVGGGPGHWMQRSEVATDADVFGLGGRAVGPRLPEGTYRLWNVEGPVRQGPGFPTPVTMPVRLVVAGAGSHLVFHDNSWDGELTLRHGRPGEGSGFDRPGRCALTMAGGPVRYWVLPGPPSRALRGWARLTGGAVVPPRWALGHQHVVERWDLTRVTSLVTDWRERGSVPRGLHLGARGGTSMPPREGGDRRAGVERDLSRLVPEFRRAGVELVRGVSPRVAVRPGEEWYECGLAGRVFVREEVGTGWFAGEPRTVTDRTVDGDLVYPDFTGPRTREWWGRAYQPLFAEGAGGVWHQPYETAAHGRGGHDALPLSARHALEGRSGDHREAHNVCGLTMARAAYEMLDGLGTAGANPLFVSGGWAGSQRYGGVCLPTPEGWEEIRAALAAVLGLGLSGVPLVGVDVEGEPSTEWGSRLLQLGAWLPLFRTSTRQITPLAEPPGADSALAVAAALVERERLLPYLGTLAAIAATTGAPIARPLWWGSPSDRSLRRQSADAFLLGEAFLVAPVCEPGVVERAVRLPRGGWYDVATGEVFRGPGVVRVEAPLGRVPVLARAGAVVPVAESDGTLALEVWSPRPGGVGGGLYVPLSDGEVSPGDGEAGGGPRRYTARAVGGTVRVAREDGRPLDCPVRVRGEGA